MQFYFNICKTRSPANYKNAMWFLYVWLSFCSRMWQEAYNRLIIEAYSRWCTGVSGRLALPSCYPRRARGGVLLRWSAHSWSMGVDCGALCWQVSIAIMAMSPNGLKHWSALDLNNYYIRRVSKRTRLFYAICSKFDCYYSSLPVFYIISLN